jgi:hypothetical protein
MSDQEISFKDMLFSTINSNYHQFINSIQKVPFDAAAKQLAFENFYMGFLVVRDAYFALGKEVFDEIEKNLSNQKQAEPPPVDGK